MLMQGGGTRVADQLDTVQDEIDSVVHIVTMFINLSSRQ